MCTSTLAWGVNFPAHLVVVKGTEFFDGKTGRYVDFPITDLLQVRLSVHGKDFESAPGPDPELEPQLESDSRTGFLPATLTNLGRRRLTRSGSCMHKLRLD